MSIKFGTQRREIYMRAAESVEAHCAVRGVSRPRWGVKPMRSTNHKSTITGITVDGAEKGDGVWVRVEGPADVAVF